MKKSTVIRYLSKPKPSKSAATTTRPRNQHQQHPFKRFSVNSAIFNTKMFRLSTFDKNLGMYVINYTCKIWNEFNFQSKKVKPSLSLK